MVSPEEAMKFEHPGWAQRVVGVPKTLVKRVALLVFVPVFGLSVGLSVGRSVACTVGGSVAGIVASGVIGSSVVVAISVGGASVAVGVGAVFLQAVKPTAASATRMKTKAFLIMRSSHQGVMIQLAEPSIH